MTPLRPVAIVGGHVVDPASGYDRPGEVLLTEGRVVGIAAPGEHTPVGATLDVGGRIVCPGLVDLHVHLREPGQSHKETIRTGTRAAVAGGFTTVCCMPNTTPALDRPERIEALYGRLAAEAACRVYAIGAACLDNEPGRSADALALAAAGCVALSDDAFPLETQAQRREALERAAAAGLPFVAHCEDQRLSRGGVVNEGEVSRQLGARGQPAAAETEALIAWLSLAGTGARLHVAHVSAAASVEALLTAREAWGERLTAETAPHHFALTEEAVLKHGANAKMNPPLRAEGDRRAIRAAVGDGTLAVIATDHAPHTPAEKAAGLGDAPFGVVGLETALAVCLTHLNMPLGDIVARLTINPARAFGLPGGRLLPGAPADVTIFDPDAEWTVDADRFQSRGRNTPFAGCKLRGRPWAVLVGGRLVWREGEFLGQG